MDYSQLKKKVKRITIKAKLKKVGSKFVDFASYYLAIFALVQMKFIQDNKFVFEINDIWSYVMVLLCAVLFYFGSKNLFDEIVAANEIVVTRDELHDLINFARYNATESVINFAGDISWLKNDLKDIEYIKSIHTGVTFSLYYDKRRTSSEDKDKIRNLQRKGIISAISYPCDDIVKIRCMFVDLHSTNQLSDNSKAYVYQRCADNSDKFIWHEYSSKDKTFSNAVESIVGLLSLVKTPSIRVGFSGINNVGKTTLANKCVSILSKHKKTKLYTDAFYDFDRKNNYDNMCVLFEQLTNESSAEEGINLFDRTVFDNYQYSYLRATTNSHHNLQKLYPLVADSMTKYDLIVYVKRKVEKYDFDTTHVTRTDRKNMDRQFEHFYRTKRGLKTKTVYVDFDDFENSIDILSKEISNDVVQLYEKKCRQLML